MTDKEVSLVLGGLLHDIGKVIYRQGSERKKHSQIGYEFLKEQVGLTNQDVLDAVLYHHADGIKHASIARDSLAYIVYIADNIASAADRRKNDSEDADFEISMPLQSVFNILNGNHQHLFYEPKTLDERDAVNYPIAEKKRFDEHFYVRIKENLFGNLKGIEWSQEYIHSLLETLEANLSYVPSSTAKDERVDISLYDHMKLTAAVAACLYGYLEEKGVKDYRDKLFLRAKEFYQEEAFLLCSMDISGIQDFIYTIASKNALKTLRARSFYLEIMMEHIIDCFLEDQHLTRANLLYCGGGHCYILMANTSAALKKAEQYMDKLNHWLMEQFSISLYVAFGYAACSCNTLKNFPEGSYSQLFKNVGAAISRRKSHRYPASDIRRLNMREYGSYTRECKVCRRIGKTDDEGVCSVCRAIENFSNNILYSSFFTVTLEKSRYALPLPGDYYLVADDQESLVKKMQQDDDFVRTYSKNKMYTGKHMATKLWVGDYTTKKTFEEYAAQAQGIERIGVIRADVDNLGQAFVSGFENPDNHNRYVTLSRTATLSRQLSLFFKYHINKMLAEGSFFLEPREQKSRNATIVYSGGDDLFIVGAWDDVIGLAIDIRRNFEKYTQGTLTLSAGIGIYEPSYPISAIARETAGLEDESKKYPGKNAVTLLPEDSEPMAGSYSWGAFEQKVLQEKYQAIKEFFSVSEERGMSFLYRLLELLRNKKEKINFARYVYILSRLEPEKDADKSQKDAYQKFAQKMYQWMKDEEENRQLRTAISLYVYEKRAKEIGEDEIE